MISRYGIFCRVIEASSFTRVAEEVGYSQSAVSQTIKSLENETGMVLVDRKKDGIRLTADGAQFFPYFQAIYTAENALAQKQHEMAGMENSTIVIGTFTSVSRNILPPLMKQFKQIHPGVNFVLRQGEYTGIVRWVREGAIDFGFVNADAVSGVELCGLYRDRMMAVLPHGHPLAEKQSISLRELAQGPFILLEEGEYSVMLTAFERAGLEPRVEYEVYDDYSILAMVRQGLGITAIYERVVKGYEAGLAVRPIDENPVRAVALAWRNRDTMSYAAREFADFIRRKVPDML